ncbi:choline/carnitine O-acyltransferase [Endozoicomonadaceae bacterium StTr2]
MPSILQSKLASLETGNHFSSLLGELWKKSYLSDRRPLPYASNYILVLDTSRISGDSFFHKLAVLTIKLLPEEAPASSSQCAEQHYHLYSTRIPEKEEDRLIDTSQAEYFAVVTPSGIHKINTKQGITPAALATFYHAQADFALSQSPPGCCLPSVTRQPRDEAALSRQALANQPCIEMLDQALFIVILDPPMEHKNSLPALFESLLLGENRNRWFDKSLQIIAVGEQHIGLNLAHSHVDGTTWVERLGREQIKCDTTCLAETQFTADGPYQFGSFPPELTSQENESSKTPCVFVHETFQRPELQQLAAAMAEKKIKDFSLDAFVQIAIVAAQYQVFVAPGGKFRNTYESVAMSNYHFGRTECARAVCEASIQYATHPSQENLVKALGTHKQQIRILKSGRGFERALFLADTLLTKQERDQLPASVTNALQWLNQSPISTSNLSPPTFRHFVFCPTTNDGFGIGYSIASEEIRFNISCFQPCYEQAQQLRGELIRQFEQQLTLLGSDYEQLQSLFRQEQHVRS